MTCWKVEESNGKSIILKTNATPSILPHAQALGRAFVTPGAERVISK